MSGAFGLLHFTAVVLKPKIVDAGRVEHNVRAHGSVWLNPMGVNSVSPHHTGADATTVIMDDGSEFSLLEPVETVVERINVALREREGLDA